MNHATKVLIIDDDATTRTTLATLVKWAGSFEVLEAGDGVSGRALAKQHVPDLILLDIFMPGCNGYEVCADLRGDPATREVPIFVLSSASETDVLTPAFEAGADDFLRKPFDVSELRAKIRSVARLNRYKALREERERFRWLLDRSLEPLLMLDRTGALVFANARAREVFDLSETPGLDVVAAIERHYRSDPPEALRTLRARSFAPGLSFALVRPETEHVAARWFNVEQQATDSSSGELLLKFTDRSGWVRRELETWSFQHMVFHKMRTPLNGLGNVLDIVAQSDALATDRQTSGLLDIARESAHRLETSLLSVLDYHQALFRGPSPTRPQEPPTPLSQLVHEAAQEARLARVELQGTDHTIPAQLVGTLRLVLSEVCDNYAKFSQAPAAGMTVQVAVEAGELRVRLFAPGPVPPPEALAQIGRPYWQMQARFTGEIPGMGLGLATARLFLRSHGGDLRLDTDEGRHGVSTLLSVPMAPERPQLP